jgi:hypothetical protein
MEEQNKIIERLVTPFDEIHQDMVRHEISIKHFITARSRPADEAGAPEDHDG